MVKTTWKFDEGFKNSFLDIWWDKDKSSYNQALKACKADGTEMMVWLVQTNQKLHDKIYHEALLEKQDSVVAERLGEVDYDLGKMTKGRFTNE